MGGDGVCHLLRHDGVLWPSDWRTDYVRADFYRRHHHLAEEAPKGEVLSPGTGENQR